MRLTLLFLGFFATLAAQPQRHQLLSAALSDTVAYYTWDAAPALPHKAVVYLTDGEKLLRNGTQSRIEQLTASGAIPAAYYVFVSTIHPGSGADLRNEYFFCNPDYLTFFIEELMPAVEGGWPVPFTPRDRSLVGFSFGGLNVAYFSAHTDAFGGYGLLSPITYPCEDILRDIVFSTTQELSIFLSTGTNDAETYLRPLERFYRNKKYTIKTVQTEGGHDFANWNGQLRELLNFLLQKN